MTTTTIPTMSYQSFVNSCNYPSKYERKGQHAMNLLYRVRPDLYDAATNRIGTDPFYQDENLPAFFAFIESEWDS